MRSVLLSDILKQTIGVIDDEENNTLLLIGLDGDAVSLTQDNDEIDVSYQEFGEAN
jgi:hypothetical protein